MLETCGAVGLNAIKQGIETPKDLPDLLNFTLIFSSRVILAYLAATKFISFNLLKDNKKTILNPELVTFYTKNLSNL